MYCAANEVLCVEVPHLSDPLEVLGDALAMCSHDLRFNQN